MNTLTPFLFSSQSLSFGSMNAVSAKAATLIGSEIIKLASEINQKIKSGERIFNLTIGDFNPSLFPIPDRLKQLIIDAYIGNETNYPPADGIADLKSAVAAFIRKYENLEYSGDEIIISGGGRPLIYAIYQTIVDEGDMVVYPVPSWNNNHYCHLSEARKAEVITSSENSFMPLAEELEPYIGEAVLIALCSPLNPTGTTFRKEQLTKICRLVLDENKKRGGTRKPLYILYDQIYWMLHAEGQEHFNPVSINPEMRPYTIFVDGISKSLSATGVRVGWSLGPANIISKMKSILGHIGAWAPKAEQVATAKFLFEEESVHEYLTGLKLKINKRFDLIYAGIESMRKKGLPVTIIKPEGAIYLSAQFSLIGKIKPDGTKIERTEDITAYLLTEAKFAAVPFTAFGCESGTDWYRLSIGTISTEEIPDMLRMLEEALERLR